MGRGAQSAARKRPFRVRWAWLHREETWLICEDPVVAPSRYCPLPTLAVVLNARDVGW